MSTFKKQLEDAAPGKAGKMDVPEPQRGGHMSTLPGRHSARGRTGGRLGTEGAWARGRGGGPGVSSRDAASQKLPCRWEAEGSSAQAGTWEEFGLFHFCSSFVFKRHLGHVTSQRKR